MSRPLWSLRSFLWPVLFLHFPFPLLFCWMFFVSNPLPIGFLFIHIGLTVFVTVAYSWQHRWLWRFCRRVRRFVTVENSRIVLHYESEMASGETISALLQSCQMELDKLTRWFRFPPRRRVTVFLFAHWRDIGAIFGPAYGGCAILQANAIVIARDNYVGESLKHELAHLYSTRWNTLAPPLLNEGLSVYLQGSEWGQPIDAAAVALLRRGGPRLSALLRAKFFFAEPQAQSCYTLAGSFTGFLIRRYGWDRYRQLYRRCNGIRFAPKFRKCFGVSLEKAEWQWRNEVMVMDILNRRIGRMPLC